MYVNRDLVPPVRRASAANLSFGPAAERLFADIVDAIR